MRISHGVAMVVLALGCGDEDPPLLGAARATVYEQLIDAFDSRADCDAWNAGRDFIVNCVRWVTFCDSGVFELFVTDTGNQGEYAVSGRTALAEVTVRSDGPAGFTFVLDGDGATASSPELAGRHPWVRVILEGDARDLAEQTCENLEAWVSAGAR